MTKKAQFKSRAKQLYTVEMYSIKEISKTLDVAEKTIYNWKKIDRLAGDDWDAARDDSMRKALQLHEIGYDIALQLGQSILNDLQAGKTVEQSRLYSFVRILPALKNAREYEEGDKGSEAEKVTKEELRDLLKTIAAEEIR